MNSTKIYSGSLSPTVGSSAERERLLPPAYRSWVKVGVSFLSLVLLASLVYSLSKCGDDLSVSSEDGDMGVKDSEGADITQRSGDQLSAVGGTGLLSDFALAAATVFNSIPVLGIALAQIFNRQQVVLDNGQIVRLGLDGTDSSRDGLDFSRRLSRSDETTGILTRTSGTGSTGGSGVDTSTTGMIGYDYAAFDRYEQRVGSQVDGYSDYPSVAWLKDGGWLIGWRNVLSSVTLMYYPYVQRYASDGKAMGNAFRPSLHTVGPGPNNLGPKIAALNDGGWVVAWASDAFTHPIYAQRYASNGEAVNPEEFMVNENNVESYWRRERPAVTPMMDGGWVICWMDSEQDGSGWGIYARRYAASGEAFKEFRVNGYTYGDQSNPAIAALKDGGWVVTWDTANQRAAADGIYSQRYDVNGDPMGEQFKVNEDTKFLHAFSTVAALDDGGWVVTWYGDSEKSSDIYAQRYAASGKKVGKQFRVNTYTEDTKKWFPAIAAIEENGWVVTWSICVRPRWFGRRNLRATLCSQWRERRCGI